MSGKIKRELAFLLALLMLVQAPVTARAEMQEAPAAAEAEMQGAPAAAEAEMQEAPGAAEAEMQEAPAAAEAETEETSEAPSAEQAGVTEAPEALKASETAAQPGEAAGEDDFVFVPGFVNPGIEIPELKSGKSSGLMRSDASMEASYNSIEEGLVPAVREQAPYGTCWAFSAVDTALITMRKKGLEDADALYSPLAHAYYFYHPTGDPLGLTGRDSNRTTFEGGDWLNAGGNIFFSVLKMSNWVGPSSEESVPYEMADLEMSLAEEDAYQDEALLENAYFIPETDRELIKGYLAEYGALAASYKATANTGKVEYGRSDETYGNCFYQKDSLAKNANHAVIIVGWDDNIPKESFATASDARPSKDGAWLVRNSWGTDRQSACTGEGEESKEYEGYFWMSYEEPSICCVTALDPISTDSYDRCYQYDGSSYSDSTLTAEKGDSIANIWQAAQDERLTAVSNIMFTTDFEYSVQIYTSEDPMRDPEDGTPVFEEPLSGTVATAGLYTLRLPESVVIPKGTWFSVVYTNESDGQAEFVLERTCDDRENETIFYNDVKPGQSFCTLSAGWGDLAAERCTARIKALTVDVHVEELSFSKNNFTVTKNYSRTLKLSMEPAGLTEEITVSSSDPATVTASYADGKVIVKGLKTGKAVITAESAVNHVKAECTITVTSGGSSSGGGGGGGGTAVSVTAKASGTATYSGFWKEISAGKWRVFNRAGSLMSSCWLCDDAVAANGKNIWYLLDAQGDMITAGLVQDPSGNYYSLETEHNGYFGMLRYQNGNYLCSGQTVYLEFEQSHNGAFASIKNADGIEKLKQIYGVTKVEQTPCVYTAAF